MIRFEPGVLIESATLLGRQTREVLARLIHFLRGLRKDGDSFNIEHDLTVEGALNTGSLGATTTEQVQDVVGAMATDSSSIDFTYNDGANTLTAAVIAEWLQDSIAAMLLDGTNIDLVYDDGAGTITFNITGTLARGNLPSQIAYEDEANTFSSRQNFTAGATIGTVSGTLGQITSAAGNTTGWFVIGRAGVTYCLGMMNEAGSIVWRTPNGTQNFEVIGMLTIGGTLDHNGSQVGLYGVTPVNRAAAITQTYATADRTHAARTAAALTDNTAGTVSTTLAALPDPADAPASADALRDDLVTNILPVLRNWAASLADQTNKGRVDALDSAQLLNSLVDDTQAIGINQ